MAFNRYRTSSLFQSLLEYLPDDFGELSAIAKEANLDPCTLWKWKNGLVTGPHLNSLLAVAEVLGLTLKLGEE